MYVISIKLFILILCSQLFLKETCHAYFAMHLYMYTKNIIRKSTITNSKLSKKTIYLWNDFLKSLIILQYLSPFESLHSNFIYYTKYSCNQIEYETYMYYLKTLIFIYYCKAQFLLKIKQYHLFWLTFLLSYLYCLLSSHMSPFHSLRKATW